MEAGEEGEGGSGAVEEVEVEAGDLGLEEAADLGVGPGDADGFGRVGVGRGGRLGFERRELGGEGVGVAGAAEGGEFFDLGVRERGQEAGDDGDGDAEGAAASDEGEVGGVVEEELGGDEVGAGVHLFLEVAEVVFGRGGFGVGFGVAADAEAEFGIVGADEGDEFAGVAKAVGMGLESGGAFGRVAAEGHEVAEAGVAELGEDAVQLGAGVADAGEVGHDLEAEAVAQDEAVFEGAFAGGAAGAIGDGDEVGAEGDESGGGVEDLARAFGGLGREEFDRDQGAAGLEEGRDGLAGVRHRIKIYGYVDMCKGNSIEATTGNAQEVKVLTWWIRRCIQPFSMKPNYFSACKSFGAVGVLMFGVGVASGADEKTVPDLGLVLEHIPAGNFTMGNPEHIPDYKVDETPHPVTISQEFWLGKTEVTQGQWKALMNTTVKDQARIALADDSDYPLQGTVEKLREYFRLRKDSEPNSGEVPMVCNEGDDYPMYWVNLRDAQTFCYKLTLRERKAGRLSDDYEYTLPTEAQWEYACRAGTTTATYAGAMVIKGKGDAPILQDIAWYGGNSAEGYEGKGWNTHGWYQIADFGGIAGPRTVATKKPNAWGLYDMLGNLDEWTKDWYQPYPKTAVTDPWVAGGSVEINVPIVRGGGWRSAAFRCQAGYRYAAIPNYRFLDLGFRVALTHVPPLGKYL